MKDLKEFKPLWKFVKEDKNKIIFASVLIFIVEFACMFFGYLTGAAIEAVVNSNMQQALIYFLIYFIIGIVFEVYIYKYASTELRKIENKITKKLELKAYIKALNMPAYGYEKTSSGEIINRITSDTNILSSSFLNILELFSYIISGIIILIYVFCNSWILGLEIVLSLVIIYFLLKKYNPKTIKMHKDIKKIQDKFISLTNESIRGIREVKTLGIKKKLINNVESINNEILDKSIDEIKLNKQFRIDMNSIKNDLEIFVYVTSAILVFKQKVSLSFFISMTYYIYRFMSLIENIDNCTQTYQKMIVSLQRVNEIIENRLYKDDKFGSKSIKNIKGNIKFENVNFSYPNEENLLNDFNIELSPNKKIAIVGASGQGKSTLFNLLTRLFDPTSGNILIDDINIKDFDEDSIRKHISIIRQEPFIFNRSIFDNFKLLNENITLEDVKKYCKMAYLDDYIMSLPNGYNTILGEGGVNLSGGQKQRLSIARVLSKDSKIILFDEATSALDNNSQSYIKKSIDNLVEGHTVIIVAHRLSTIIDADIIYVIDKGKVVESGTHNELLKNSLIYKKLYESESFE